MDITFYQHNILAQFYKRVPVPENVQKEIVASSYGISYAAVESWLNRCQVVGPEALWAEISLEKEKSEEQERKREREEEMAFKKKITYYQHKTLTKFFETNPIPDHDQMEIIGKSVEMTNVAVDCWFFRCRTVGPEALWQEVGEEAEIKKEKNQKEQLEAMLQYKNKLEEQVETEKKENEELRKIIAQQTAELRESKNLIADKDAEIQNLIKNSVKDRTDEIQQLKSWITNITTMSHVQSDSVRLLKVEKELARVSSMFEEAELKKENQRLKKHEKEFEAMLQFEKKLEKQVEELSFHPQKMNDKIETTTQKTQQQSVDLKESTNLLAGIQNLTSIQNSVKDTVNALQEQLGKLVNEITL
ncbi:hypothetical protein GCK72_015877 [Caenorhabditis remanei]|uniref:Homeobox domain-containing protein n=1 Tax=Caenorhabditis remanei TaxID=31234 RepID=A0A6A5GV91_CAERE|nr:hypothetical protein GCK72_015877 [Caenorhabditis remanei]KAF1759410.1 hypothetical protein GCK72_015877 [Caenorhabditis remanei]